MKDLAICIHVQNVKCKCGHWFKQFRPVVLDTFDNDYSFDIVCPNCGLNICTEIVVGLNTIDLEGDKK